MMNGLDKMPNEVSIHASSKVFQTYESGVLNSSLCGTSTNHAVVAVGYNSSASDPYWIVRNSWGVGWGDFGYINIGMTADYPGTCGIMQRVGYPHTQRWTN
jgi:C1A family cysteine protease